MPRLISSSPANSLSTPLATPIHTQASPTLTDRTVLAPSPRPGAALNRLDLPSLYWPTRLHTNRPDYPGHDESARLPSTTRPWPRRIHTDTSRLSRTTRIMSIRLRIARRGSTNQTSSTSSTVLLEPRQARTDSPALGEPNLDRLPKPRRDAPDMSAQYLTDQFDYPPQVTSRRARTTPHVRTGPH